MSMATTKVEKPEPASTWHAVLGRLQLEIPHEQFRQFLVPAAGHSWEGDALVVAAPHSFAVSWLTLPLHLEMAEEALAKTVGETARILYRAMPHVFLSAPSEPSGPDATAGTAPEKESDHCPEHPEDYLRWRTRWDSIRRQEQKYEDEVYYCAGDDRCCSWVYSLQLGVLVPSGKDQLSPLELLRTYKGRQSQRK